MSGDSHIYVTRLSIYKHMHQVHIHTKTLFLAIISVLTKFYFMIQLVTTLTE